MNEIIVYTKTGCPWRKQVIDFLNRYDLPYEERNMTEHPEFEKECEEKTGQSKCPTFDIDGHLMPDSDADQLEAYLNQQGVL